MKSQVQIEFTGNDIKTLYYVINVHIRTVSQTDSFWMAPRSVPRPLTGLLARSGDFRPQRGGLGSPNHIKESIKIKPRGTRLSYHVTWCAVEGKMKFEPGQLGPHLSLIRLPGLLATSRTMPRTMPSEMIARDLRVTVEMVDSVLFRTHTKTQTLAT